MEDDENGYCEAELDQIACYEEKKLLIQNAEERCDNLKDQLDYLRAIIINNNYYQIQHEGARAVPSYSPDEEELDDCIYLKASDMLEDNQLYSDQKSYSKFSQEKSYASGDENSDDGVLREMEADVDEEKLDESCDSKDLNNKTNVSHFLPPCNEHPGQDWYAMINNFERGDFEDELLNSKQKNKKMKGERHESRTCKSPKSLITSSREGKKQILGKDTLEHVRTGNHKKLNKPCDDKYKSTTIKECGNIKQSNLTECRKNYRSTLVRTTSIISATTVPSSNFKKENESHLPTTKDSKLRKLAMLTERSNESKPDNDIKRVVTSKSLRNSSYHQKALNEKISANNIPAPKTRPRTNKQFDNNECGDCVIENQKRFSNASLIANSRQNLSMQWKEMSTGKSTYCERPCGKSKKVQPDLKRQPISIRLFDKASGSPKEKPKEKDKLTSIGSQEKTNDKTRILRNGFGLHTISSKLKMSEKIHSQKHTSKYPFIVGKSMK